MSYNCGIYLQEAMESVLAQKKRPDFIHIVDDCSEDNSAEIMELYRNSAEIYINQTNLGITSNFNAAMERVKTDYAFFLDADNVISPHYIEKAILQLEENPAAVVAATDMFVFGKLAKDFAEEIGLQVGKVDYLNVDGYIWKFPKVALPLQAKKLANENFIQGNSVFSVKRFREVGGLGGLKPEDHQLWKKMIKDNYCAVQITEPLLAYRKHSNTQAQTILELKHRINYLQLENIRLQEILEKVNTSRSVTAWIKRKVSTRTKIKIKSYLYRLTFFATIRRKVTDHYHVLLNQISMQVEKLYRLLVDTKVKSFFPNWFKTVIKDIFKLLLGFRK